MKRLAVISMTMAALTLSVSGQRGGARAGAVGGMRIQGGTPQSASSRGALSRVGESRFAGGASAARPGGYKNDNRRAPYAADRFRPRYGSYNAGVPLIIPLWSGWNEWADQGTGYEAVGPVEPSGEVSANEAQAPEPGPYLPLYPPAPVYQSAPPVSRPDTVLPSEEAVTLVFRDGRTVQEIHNYALTRTRLMVLDGRPREIPLEQLDFDATERVNRAAGVDFKLPKQK